MRLAARVMVATALGWSAGVSAGLASSTGPPSSTQAHTSPPTRSRERDLSCPGLGPVRSFPGHVPAAGSKAGRYSKIQVVKPID